MKRPDQTSAWKTQVFQDRVKVVFGKERSDQTLPIVQGLAAKSLIVKHHFRKAAEALDPYPAKSNPREDELIDLIFADGERYQAFSLAKLEHEANLIAAAQALHSMSDNWAHLLYTTFCYPFHGEYRPKLEGVRRQLQSASLVDAINFLLGLREYAYLKEFVNHNKHMHLVQSPFKVEFPDDRDVRHGVKFKAFGKHPSKWGGDFLRELRTVLSAQVRIGVELNQSLGTGA